MKLALLPPPLLLLLLHQDTGPSRGALYLPSTETIETIRPCERVP